MKKIRYNIKYFAGILSIGIAVILFWTCTDDLFKEKLQQICEGESQPVLIQFKAKAESVCGTGDSLGIPRNAVVEFSFATQLRTDTAFIYLDENGEGQYEIEEGCTGVDLLWIDAGYGENYLSWQRDSFGILCCQENLIDSIYFLCSSSEPTAVNCDALNDTIVIDFNTNGKITVLTTGIPVFEQAIVSGDTVSVDFTELLAFTSNYPQINVDYRPGIDLNQPVFEVYERNPMILRFSLDNSQLLEIVNEEILLKTTCVNDPDKQGNILIIINAVVEEVSCNCPFEDNPITYNLPATGTEEKVPVGSSIEYIDLTIAWNTMGLDTSCTLVIESIVQETGNSNDHPEYWSNPVITPAAGNTFKNQDINVRASFTPLTPGASKASYTISLHVESATGTVEGPCSFTLECEAVGCENFCPSITILNSGSKLEDGTNLALGSKIDFGSGSTIIREMKHTITTDCLEELGNYESASFKIGYENEFACNDLNFDYVVTGDYPNDIDVTIISPNTFLNGIDPLVIFITYEPNTNREEGTYNYTLELTAGDSDGFYCSQIIQITGIVESITSKISTGYTMSTFSQIAEDNKASGAAHVAYKIDEFDDINKTYGKLTSGIINYVETGTYDFPGSEADYTFYFDVDNPKDWETNFNQEPELYLVNNDLNKFEYITRYPVAYLSGADDLDSLCSEKGNYELIRHIFMNDFSTFAPAGITPTTIHNFTYTETPLMWSNSIPKSGINHPDGIELREGGVYVLWDNLEIPSFLDNNKVYCHLALLFIYDIKTGEENKTPLTNENGRATVTFYVQYPLEVP
ncbi:MAG: hypothetical protein JW798_08895 [Prolixibacteraceae bacterium]|nr:hypothetical protein [Prolixibacteraceae bacterium]